MCIYVYIHTYIHIYNLLLPVALQACATPYRTWDCARCLYINMYTHTYIYKYIYIQTNKHTCIYIHKHMFAFALQAYATPYKTWDFARFPLSGLRSATAPSVSSCAPQPRRYCL